LNQTLYGIDISEANPSWEDAFLFLCPSSIYSICRGGSTCSKANLLALLCAVKAGRS